MLNKTIHICFLLIFALCLLVSCDKIAKQRARHYFENGKKLYDTREYIKAKQNFDIALIFDPTFFEAFYWRGMAYYRQGAFAEAYENLSKASMQRPEDMQLRFQAVDAAIKCRQYGKAIVDLEAILGTDKSNKEALFLKLYCQIKIKRPRPLGLAKNGIREAIEKGTDDPRIYCLDAQFKIVENSLAEAEVLLAEHYSSHQVWCETMKLLAEAYIKKLDFEMMKKTYDTMLSKAEGNEDKYLLQTEFAALLMQNNQLEAAGDVLRAMIQYHPGGIRDKINLLNCLIVLGKLSEAEQITSEETKKNPDNFDFKKIAIRISLKKVGIEKTMEVAKKILSSLQENSPQYIELKNIIADICFSSEKLEESKMYSQEVLAVQPNNAEAKFNLCRIALRNKSSIAVIGDLRRLINENPGNAEYSYYLGLAHKARGEDILAQTALQDALAKSPGHKHALISLSDIYRERGIYKELERYVGNYLKLNPNDEEVKSLLQKAKQRPPSIDNDTQR